MNDDEQAEVVNFECRDCGEEFDLLLWPNDFDRCIKETGHDGHRWVICEYVQIQGNPWINATTK